MLQRCIKLILFCFLAILSMGTSCIKAGKSIYVVHKIDCPPVEFHFPLTSLSSHSSIEMQHIQPSKCKNTTIYDINIDSETKISYIFTSLIREKKSCKLVSVIPIVKSGTGSYFLTREEIPHSKRFKDYKKALQLLPRLIFKGTNVKVNPNPKIIDTKQSKLKPDEWCSK